MGEALLDSGSTVSILPPASFGNCRKALCRLGISAFPPVK